MRNIEVIEKMNEVKAQGRSSKSYISNCYINFALEPEDREWDALTSERSLIIIIHECKVNRIVFMTSDSRDIVELAQKIPNGCVIDIITKEPLSFRNVIEEMGFHHLAEMQKVSCKNIVEFVEEKYSACTEKDKSVCANMDDLDSIYTLLWDTFDTRVSHLPSKDELGKKLARDEFRIIKSDNTVISLNQAIVEPKSYYFNQVVNMTKKEDFHSMIIHSLKRYCDNGGKYAYAWVENSNKASLKFFKKYGMEPDGMLIEIYVN